jgi:hypothetical protein
VDLPSLRRLACGLANRNLTAAEWHQYFGPQLPYHRTCPALPAG